MKLTDWSRVCCMTCVSAMVECSGQSPACQLLQDCSMYLHDVPALLSIFAHVAVCLLTVQLTHMLMHQNTRLHSQKARPWHYAVLLFDQGTSPAELLLLHLRSHVWPLLAGPRL